MQTSDAFYMLSTKPISTSNGMSAVRAAAYRSGEMLYSERDSKTYDFTRKHGIFHTEILLPPNAPLEFLDRQTLWNEVERVENRKNSRFAREVIIALPRNLLLETSVVFVREFVIENFVSLGMCADIAIHIGHQKGEPHIEDDHEKVSLHNPHCHIMLTDRPVSRHGFAAKKNPDWNSKQLLLEWRKEWANIQNKTFARKGLSVRVSHESYKARGIDCEPTMHLGPVLSKMERRGIKTALGNKNRAIEAQNLENKKRQQRLERNYEQTLELSR